MTSRQHTTLEPLNETHCKQTFAWVSQPFIQRTFAISSPPNWETHVQYFPTLMAEDKRSFAVLHNGEHVGNCGLRNVVVGDAAELWIYIGERSVYGKGVGTEATRLLIEYGFDSLKLKTMYLHVSKDNKPAVALYEKAGFKEAGKPEGWDHREDMIRMELHRGQR